ncbi:hypothetical protein BO70DRAFT_323526 [Aspergillus heteromorphus CBS 117.55]|uniref:Zn(II)2Cys6 transcription factor n=1 Tax=Aspergillus heteromorphus CBS 117.55 TaxID=1448321 RepID=A0A317V4B3_9EURO|nr:uncharacterized protein BO70DRAFT_323526 [Aspergillus heteromorphus CBS 117.55]PWY67918.1 hypothetical protein BO70DRAFT_323526 [Aspergillus heteromorphus CBS 117.55]
MTQLELTLEWINHTHKCFARNEETRKVWEKIVLQEALNTPFLLHGILALSALHLSHLREDGRHVMWLDIAIAHKNTALSIFSEQLNNISQSNAKAMMSFASMAFAFGLASALKMGVTKEGSKLEALTNVFVLARGIQSVIFIEETYIHQSSFAPLFNMTPPEVTIPEDVLMALDRLKHLHDRYSLHSPDHDPRPYNTAINTIERLISYTYKEPTSMTLAGGWAMRVPEEYLDDLKSRKPLALVVLAHLCVFLHLGQENWCMGSWGREVMEDIIAILDSDWRPHISWASEQVLGARLTS